jgi:AAA domain
MTLKFTTPEPTEERFKGLFYGPWGCGKTTIAMQTPHAAYVDMERGTDKYYRTLKSVGSKRLKTTSFYDLLEQVRELSTVKHDFVTLVIDPITIANQDLRDFWIQIFDKHAKTEKESDMKDYGVRYWGKVKFDMTRLRRALLNLDMNIIAIAHEKDKYENNKAVGVTFDADGSKEGYLFDNIFRVKQENGKLMAYTEKQRTDLGQPKLPAIFEWTYPELLRIVGKDVLERPAKPVPLITPEQLAKINEMMPIFEKIEPEFADKVFAKHKIDSWDELLTEPATQVISYIEKQLKGGK